MDIFHNVVDGNVYSWGSGIYGQLGHGNLRDRFSPLMIGVPLRGVGITLVSCHEYHSAAVAGKQIQPVNKLYQQYSV